MTILIQILLGVIFLFISLVSFSFVGFLLLKKLKLNLEDGMERFVLSSVLGLVLFTIVAYILAFFNLRFLMWIFPIIGFYVFVTQRKSLKSLFPKITAKRFFLAVFLIGVIGQVAVNAPSGFPYKDGIYFYSSHGHDGIWHLALMQEMHKSGFPFQNPEYAGYKLQNYHFFADLLMSEFSRLFYFSNLDVYFRFMPIVFSILMGLSAFIFVREWGKSEIAGIWAMVFTYFAGSFGYLLYIPTHKALGGESIFWVSQTQSVLGNPPHAAAFVILTTFLFCLLKYTQSRQVGYFLLCALFGGAVIEFKVYAGILLLGGLFVLGIAGLMRKSYHLMLLFLVTLLIALAIYLPNTANSEEFLVWEPWWFIRTMVVATDRLNWLDLELRRQTYIAENNWKRVVQLEGTAFLIFLFGNLGMRALGFWTIFKQFRSNIFKDHFSLFYLSIITASFFIPVFFLQKGVAWNTIQFNQYFLLMFGFLASLAVADLMKRIPSKYLKIFISFVIIILAIPTQLGLLMQFYSNKPLSKVSNSELLALDFLRDQKEGIVLVAPFNKYKRDAYKNPPIPIYAWYDTGYVPAFSGKKTLISDYEQVDIMGYDAENLLKEREEVFESKDSKKVNEFLTKHKIDYVYFAWDQQFATDSATINMDLLYENDDAKVFKVQQ